MPGLMEDNFGWIKWDIMWGIVVQNVGISHSNILKHKTVFYIAIDVVFIL